MTLRRPLRVSAPILGLLLSGTAFAQQPYRVKDIDPSTGTSDSPALSGFVAVGNVVFFGECVLVFTVECGLWRTDGTAAGTGGVVGLPDAPASGVDFNGVLFFKTWGQLWRSDGTSPGTTVVSWFPGGLGSLVVVGGTLFVTADDGASGMELWRSDGTSAGTVLVRDVNPGSVGSGPTSLTNVGGTLFFAADDGVNGRELWRSDGTSAGTVLVKDVNPGVGSSSPNWLTNADGTLFLTAEDGINGTELWHSDGTGTGTFLVKDILAGALGSLPKDITAIGGNVFFSANDDLSGRELWHSDGTATGTALVKDIFPGLSNSFPFNLTDVNGTLFFGAYEGVVQGLWKSDGTQSGTVMVKEVATSLGGVAAVGGFFFFSGSDGTSGYELWRSDGTGPGTTMVRDINPGTSSSDPSVALADANGTLFLTAYEPVYGRELWRSDGTAAGTWMIKDLWLGPGSSTPKGLAPVAGTLLFAADDGASGNELWRSDGTEPGTVLVSDINAGPPSSNPAGLEMNGVMLLRACSLPGGSFGPDDCELWTSDGTASGTTRVKDINAGSSSSYPIELTNLGGILLFSADDSVAGRELWRSDASQSGTLLLRDIRPGPEGSNPRTLLPLGGIVFFVADDGVHGEELWRTDGTSGGTVMVMDINPGPGSGLDPFALNRLAVVNGNIFFMAYDGVHGFEPWVSDGTISGTRLVKDVNPGPAGSESRLQGAGVGRTLYFTADDGLHGAELWRSNGTEAGTALVKDINPQGEAGYPYSFLVVDGRLFFSANDGVHGTELWRSDGTGPGTLIVADLSAGPASSWPAPWVGLGGTLLFGADDGVHGSELWRSDGTAAGTVLVADVRTGAFGSSPDNSARVGPLLYFTADDGVVGDELWALPLPGQLAVSASTLDFGDRRINTGPSQPLTLEILNAGGADLTVTGVSLGGDAAFALSGWPTPDPVLAPGESFVVSVTFDPTTPGPKTGTVTISSDDPWYPGEVVAVTGNATTALVATNPASISFGVVSVGATWDRTLTLLNPGTGPLTVSALGISGSGSGQFTLPSSPLPPFQVPALGSFLITVRCAPAAAGSYVASLDIDTDADNVPQDPSVPLACTGVAGLPAEAELIHGTSFARDLASVGGTPDEDLYRIRQRPYASYEVVVDGTSGDIGTGAGPAVDRLASDGATIVQSSTGTGSSRSLRWMNAAEGVMDAEYVRVRSALCGTDCGPEDVYRLRAWETTAFVPRFNNFGSQSTVVVLQNHGDQPITGQMAFWNASGALLHVEPFSMPDHGTLLLNAGTIAALAGQSGSLSVVHDGSYGVLSGKTVALEPATGFTFDTPSASRPR